MLYYEDLENIVFNMHKNIAEVNQITIVSGYVGSTPVEKLKELPANIKATVIYGMYAREGIASPLHKALVELQYTIPNLEILYSTIPVHSKIYFWTGNDEINKALIGSANFSISGLTNDYKEVLADVEDVSYSEVKNYSDFIKANSILCTDVHIHPQKIVSLHKKSTSSQPLLIKGTCRASLLNRRGKVSAKSGLNWGLSKGHVAVGDAYIAITANYIRLFPHLFPPKKYVNGMENINSLGKKNRENDEVELIWDDGMKMIALLEGQQSKKIDGMVFPKQLSSSPRKCILGEYLRKRIGVDLKHQITKADLLKYGRTSIDISLLGDGIYYMDFSVKNKI